MSLNLNKYERDKILERDEFKILITTQDLQVKFKKRMIELEKYF